MAATKVKSDWTLATTATKEKENESIGDCELLLHAVEFLYLISLLTWNLFAIGKL